MIDDDDQQNQSAEKVELDQGGKMTWPLFASKAAPCDGALIQRGGRLTRLFNMGLGAAAVR
ncbi:hypothetical protein OKW46_007470 [Paraburkholderia sp. WSM4179]|uniref:hypothetical protein n=1 Tax=Paraburkholderia sp. WSM4179 TaxID=2991073 RepID=UPI002476EB59|nr:hypothetical protein [Paraburkholderia sp. WSM4179]MDH6153480.1 hypothetical protein [Paraburkholderia sp. WSM4179]